MSTGFFETLEQEFEQGWEKLKETVSADAVAALQEGKELVQEGEQALTSLWQIGAPLALAAITSQAPLVISGAEKFGAAVASVAMDLEKQIGPVVISDVQAIVQNGYNWLKDKLSI